MGSRYLVRASVMLAVLCGAPLAASATVDQHSAAQSQWAQWVRQQVQQLPASRAIQARREQWLAESRGAEQPLYNPNLNLNYEDSAEVTQTVGLSQTLDWSGKARASRDVSAVRQALADLRAQKARADLLAQSLQALVAWDAAQARLQAARQQEQQLTELTELIRRRQQAGDVGQVDALGDVRGGVGGQDDEAQRRHGHRVDRPLRGLQQRLDAHRHAEEHDDGDDLGEEATGAA